MKTNKLISRLLLSIFAIAFLQGCASSTGSQATIEPKYTPTFDYAPLGRENTKNGITIALVAPSFAKGFLYSETSPFVEFSKNMANDFEELIIAKGYSFRGPFKTHDDMVFNDKKESSLLILVDIDMTMNFDDLKAATKTEMKGIPFVNDRFVTTKRATGTIRTGGTINLMAASPMKGVKLWKKSISLPNKTLIVNGQKQYGESEKINLLDDTGVVNPISKALEEYYQIALTTAWKHLDPEELKGITKEAFEADGREKK